MPAAQNTCPVLPQNCQGHEDKDRLRGCPGQEPKESGHLTVVSWVGLRQRQSTDDESEGHLDKAGPLAP